MYDLFAGVQASMKPRRDLIFEVTDPLGRNVRLGSDRVEHIADEHPELYFEVERIRQAVADPDWIASFRGDQLFYYRFSHREGRSKMFVRVVVWLEGNGDSGFIYTAFVTAEIEKGEVLWRKGE